MMQEGPRECEAIVGDRRASWWRAQRLRGGLGVAKRGERPNQRTGLGGIDPPRHDRLGSRCRPSSRARELRFGLRRAGLVRRTQMNAAAGDLPHAGDGRNPNQNRHGLTPLLLKCAAVERPADEIRSNPDRGRQRLRIVGTIAHKKSCRNRLIHVDRWQFGWQGGNHADHSLVAGRSAGRGHRADVYPRHLIAKKLVSEKRGCLRSLSAPPKGGVSLWARPRATATDRDSEQKRGPHRHAVRTRSGRKAPPPVEIYSAACCASWLTAASASCVSAASVFFSCCNV
jgi:hypothetical protein